MKIERTAMGYREILLKLPTDYTVEQLENKIEKGLKLNIISMLKIILDNTKIREQTQKKA
jgi:hypothetical protein